MSHEAPRLGHPRVRPVEKGILVSSKGNRGQEDEECRILDATNTAGREHRCWIQPLPCKKAAIKWQNAQLRIHMAQGTTSLPLESDFRTHNQFQKQDWGPEPPERFYDATVYGKDFTILGQEGQWPASELGSLRSALVRGEFHFQEAHLSLDTTPAETSRNHGNKAVTPNRN